MAIVSVTDLKGGGKRSAHWTVDSGRAFTRTLQVITDTAYDGPASVIAQLGSAYGDPYNPGYGSLERDLNCYMTDLSVEEMGEDGLQWQVTLGYSWYNVNYAGGGPSQSPLLMPIDVSWGLRDHETVLDVDVNGNAVVNTAGDPFDPPVVIDDPRLVMTVVRNESVFNIGWVVAYRNAVNSDPFAGFDPLFSKVLNISSKSQWHQDAGWYYQTTYEFEFLTSQINNNTSNGYRQNLVSQGFRAISSVTGKPYQITLKGQPVNAPMLLDKNGFLQGVNDPPYFVTYQGYPELPFDVFQFDPNAISGQRTGFV